MQRIRVMMAKPVDAGGKDEAGHALREIYRVAVMQRTRCDNNVVGSLLLLAWVACLGCGVTTTPPPGAAGPAASKPEASWTAIADPADATQEAFQLSDSWRTSVPDSSNIYLPSISGPTAVVWDDKSAEATCIDLREGKARGVVTIPGGRNSAITSVDVSADGKYLAAADVHRQSPSVRLWSFESNEETPLTLERPERAVVRFVPQNRLLVAQQSLPDMKKIDVAIWNVDTKERQTGFSIETGSMHVLDDGGVAISPGGKYVAIVFGTTSFVHELATGQSCGKSELDVRARLEIEHCRGLAFSRDGRSLAALIAESGGAGLYQFDFASGAFLRKLVVPVSLSRLDRNQLSTCPELQWTPSGWLLYGQTFTDGVNLGDSAANLHPHQHRLDEQFALLLDTSSPGQQPAALVVTSSKEHLLAAKQDPAIAAAPPPQPLSPAWSVEPDPAAPREVADDLRLELSDWTGRAALPLLPSPFIAIQKENGYLRYDLRTQKIDGEIKLPEATRSTLVVGLSPGGQFLLTYEGQQLLLRSFDASPPTRIAEDDFPKWVTFASDDCLLSASYVRGSGVRLVRSWDLTSGGVGHNFASRVLLEQSLSLSPGGRYLAFIDSDGGLNPKLNVFEVASGKVVGQTDIAIGPQGGTLETCYGLAFSADGATLAATWKYHLSPSIRFTTWDSGTGKVKHSADIGDEVELAGTLPVRQLMPNESLMPDAVGDGWLLFQRLVLDENGGVTATLPANTIDRQDKWLVDRNHLLALLRDKQTGYGVLVAWNAAGNFDNQLMEAIAAIPQPAPKPQPKPIASVPTHEKEEAATLPERKAPEEAESVASDVAPAPEWTLKPDPPADPLVTTAPPAQIRGTWRATFIYPNRPSPYVAILEREEGRCRLADLRTGKDVGTISAEFDVNDSIDISPDGKYLAVCIGDRETAASIWSFETGKQCAAIDDSFVSNPERCMFAATSHVLVRENELQELLLVATDVNTNTVSWKATVPKHGAHAATDVSPGGAYVAVGVGRSLHLLDTSNGDDLATLTLPIPWDENQPVTCNGVRFSPDGRQLVATCDANRVFVGWDMSTGKRLFHRVFPQIVSSGNGADDILIRWLPDGSGWVLGDRGVLVEATTGTPVWTLPETPEDLKLLGMNSSLAAESGGGADPDLRLVEKRLPGSQFVAAFAAARKAPSENVPAPAPVDLSALKESLEPPARVEKWDYKPIGVTKPAASPKLSISDVRPAAFQLAAVDPNRAVMQETTEWSLEERVMPGPWQPMRRSKLTIFDVAANKSVGDIETTGCSEMLDISPDGSLVLTGNSWKRGGPYDRLDVWAPSLKRHAVGWEPVITDPELMENHIVQAFFVDKRHVLTQSRSETVLWELPACKAVYRLTGRGELHDFSPSRAYFVQCRDFRELFIYESLTGRCVGQLEWPASLAKSMGHGVFRPDGQEFLLVGNTGIYTIIARYDLTSGKIRSEFAIPNMTQDGIEWITARYVLLHEYPRSRGKKYLLDLENRALVAQYKEGHVINVGSLDGTVWQTVPEPQQSTGTLVVRELKFPLPSGGPRLEDHAYLYPGARVALSVTSELVDREQIAEELSRKFKEAGFVMDESSPRRFHLEMLGKSFSPRTLKDGRTLSIRSFEMKWDYLVSDRKVWGDTQQVPDGVIDVSRADAEADAKARAKLRAQIRETIDFLTIPQYLFPTIEELKLPERSLATE